MTTELTGNRADGRSAGGLATSHAFGTNTISPATAAATPSVSVRYGSSRPGTVPNVPVAMLPSA
ncbi:hypothetical protein C8E95_1027 [Pseudonocardia autotrophica]|uniref:Uncharacterized protein n=2 Tax=Pseudonocardia TaxID=1847 RepID=A0A1Y2MZV7_PSEAH|nr:hypothetical protein BG845_02460 [Pseudonocardia autotrophica]TDN71991.1 hypothetical protein C8E95_1027 [Pseudonocardia autotrophica]BBG02678.1 hypothetical protein Pdca_38870 [Pseudonocardia autotrophica]GEC29367.1 hypothetical protein PSA01_63960 [Pseudonocardia saturnea]